MDTMFPSWLQPWISLLSPVTPLVMVWLAVRLILTGKIVPRKTVDDIREDSSSRIQEARAREEIWQEAYQVSEKARTEQQLLLREALAGVNAIVNLIEYGHRAPSRGGDTRVPPEEKTQQ